MSVETPLSPEEKIELLRQQIHAIRDGFSTRIVCPYCERTTWRGEKPCCQLMADCAEVIVTEIHYQGLKDTANRIQDRAN